MPIGISDRKDNFTFHEIEIFKGDTIYLFSDGLADQFGGQDDKKFGYRKFREHLLKNNSNTMSDNKIILEKAIKYKKAGIIGVDVAGPERKKFDMKKYKPLFEKARAAGLGITIHSGEAGTLEELRYVVNEIKPDRIGHGILCVKDKKIMQAIVENNITLEICPSSNIHNSVVKNIGELKTIIKTLKKNNIKFTVNTDGSEMYDTNLFKEQELLRKAGILSKEDIERCTNWSFEASFVK